MAYSDAPKPAKIKTWVWVVGAIVGGLILLGLIGSIGGQPPGNAPSEAGAPEAPSTPQAGTVAISAENLAAAFDANLIAAQKTYGGKVLDVTGTISEITTDFSNDPVLELEGSNLFLPVRAHFEANYADKFSTLSKGSQITVRCSSLATMLSTPTLDNCSLP